MTINRNNYETFFLLYIDNELSLAERKAVDEFVNANPDLQEELVMLQQSILKPDPIIFSDKNSLHKNEFLLDNAQEKLLMYLDNELSGKERSETDALIGSDTEIKKEWEILQQTKLSSGDIVIFEDKQSLYRKEPARLVAFPWKRVAAAAVFIGFGILGALIYLHRDASVLNSEIVKGNHLKPAYTSDTIKQFVNRAILPKKVPAGVKGEKVIADTRKDNIAEIKPTTKKIFTGVGIIKHSKKAGSVRLPNEEIEPLATIEKTNNLPKSYSDNLNKIGRNETIPAYVTIEKQSTNIVKPGNNNIGKNTRDNDAANVYASTTSFTDNSENVNIDRVLFMDEEKIKKTKLGGIFRKVKRVFERNTNIKPGSNNIKVANLEFAIQ